MRLRTQLITGTLLFTFLLTVVLSLVFLSEVLRERVSQTAELNGVLAQEILSSTRLALQQGLAKEPPTEAGEAAFTVAVQHALQNSAELNAMLDGLVRYSPDIQDAFVSSETGSVLVSSNPALIDAPAPHRKSLAAAGGTSLLAKRQLLYGAPETLDIRLPLQRNGQPFLAAHIGVRSTFLRNAYAPWLREAAFVCIVALGGSLLVAAALAAVALQPIERIGRELEMISARAGEEPAPHAEGRVDAVERVSSTISRLDEQIRTSEQTRSEMAMNLNSMLQTLTDGVMLFTADHRVAMANDAVAHFLPAGALAASGAPLSDVFPPGTAIGSRLPLWLRERRNVRESVTLEDNRTVQLSLDFFPGSNMGALLTLQDVAAREELERELEVSRRLASIGRLTAGVGHEVKNPINAMVVHLELLRSKLGSAPDAADAQRHVEVLASEMGRLDRVVQTLADFSRPLEPVLREQEVLPIVQAVVQLVGAEAENHGVAIVVTHDYSNSPLRILCDAELLRQGLLNIALNGMQAMPDGGVLTFRLGRDRQAACLSIHDTGIGIPPEKLGRIFDLYFTTKTSGSGIGLAMTYRIVQMHGGVIDVKSEPNPEANDHGTTFTLRLPLSIRTPSAPHLAVVA